MPLTTNWFRIALLGSIDMILLASDADPTTKVFATNNVVGTYSNLPISLLLTTSNVFLMHNYFLLLAT